MKPTVYVETTIIGYLVGWLNRNDKSLRTKSLRVCTPHELLGENDDEEV